MVIKNLQSAVLIVMVYLSVLFVCNGGETVIFQQKFVNTSDLSVSEKTIDWSSYIGSVAADVSSEAVVTIIAAGSGNPVTEGAGYLGFVSSAIGGVVGGKPISKDTASFITTKLPAIDATDSIITWTMGNSSTVATVQLLVQVGGKWYVSKQKFSNTVAVTQSKFASMPTSSVLQTFSFSKASSEWLTFNLKPWEEMAVGAPLSGDLPSGSISGIGFYISNASDAIVRIDSLNIIKKN